MQLPAQLAAHLAARIDLDPHLGPYLGPRQPAELAISPELAADLPAVGRDLPGELAAAAPAEPCVTGLAAPPPMSEAAAMAGGSAGGSAATGSEDAMAMERPGIVLRPLELIDEGGSMTRLSASRAEAL